MTRIKHGRHIWYVRHIQCIWIGGPRTKKLVWNWYSNGFEENKKHRSDCYFSAIDVTRINRQKRISLEYPDLQLALRCDEIPIPIFWEFPDFSEDDFSSVQENQEVVFHDDIPHWKEINNLICDLDCESPLLNCWHPKWRKKNLLSDNIRLTFYRNRYQDYLHFLSEDLVCCTDIAQILDTIGLSW